MTDRLQINVDLTDHPALYKKVIKLAKKLDSDKSKFTRFALRKIVSEIETGKINPESEIETKEPQV